MPKDKRIVNYITIGIILITLLEMYLGYRVYDAYRGIYQVGIFIPFLVQPSSYYMLLKKEKSFLRFRLIALVLASIALPLIIYFTLPDYTYDEGKQVVEKYLGQSKDVKFVDYSFGKDTVPVVYKTSKGLFVSQRWYYYEITSEESQKSFIVDPIDGGLMEMPESYWK